MKVWNQDGQPVEMESVDARECVVHCGYTTSPPVGAVVTEAAASELQAPVEPVVQPSEAAPDLVDAATAQKTAKK
jgi:hypothetical protein